jgi:hypothetical protein
MIIQIYCFLSAPYVTIITLIYLIPGFGFKCQSGNMKSKKMLNEHVCINNYPDQSDISCNFEIQNKTLN